MLISYFKFNLRLAYSKYFGQFMKQEQKNFHDKFSQYLSNKITPIKNQKLFENEFLDLHSQNSYDKQLNQYSASSINSSKFSPSVFGSSKKSLLESSLKKEKQSQNSRSRTKRFHRLKKLNELEENQCAICLDEIKRKSILVCKHNFCFDCLVGWFQNSNKCPYCRAQVYSFRCEGQEYEVQPKEFEHEVDEQQQIDWVCYNCDTTKQGDIVFICDRCEAYACHLQCDESLRGVSPVGQWYCHFCRQ